MNSDFNLSGPGALSMFNLFASFCISLAVNSLVILQGGTVRNSLSISCGLGSLKNNLP